MNKRLLCWVLLMLFALPGCHVVEGVVVDTVQTQIAEPQESLSTVTQAYSQRKTVGSTFYFDQLTQAQQQLYQRIWAAAYAFEPTLSGGVNAFSEEEISGVLGAVLYDNPELFWLSSSWSCSYTVVGEERLRSSITLQYVYTQAQVQTRQDAIAHAAQEILATVPTTADEYTIALQLYEYLIDAIDYDESAAEKLLSDAADETVANASNLYGALVCRRAVCGGYSSAFQYLLLQCGIEAVYVTGQAGGERHAWNLVQLDDAYYYFDVTWDDPMVEAEENFSYTSHNYFAITTDMLLQDHTLDTVFVYPQCTATQGNYFVRSGLYFESYDAQRIQTVITQAVQENRPYVELKFCDSTLLQTAYQTLMQGEQAVFSMLYNASKENVALDPNTVYTGQEPAHSVIYLVFCYYP